MQIKILAVGKKMPAWVEQGFGDYTKRLPREYRFSLVEIGQGKDSNTTRNIEREGDALLQRINDDDYVVALDVLGKSWSTEDLAAELASWKLQSRSVTFLIGGPDGLSERCLQRASVRWSLSALTLPHPLVRVVLAEQLYRAHSILSNHPYHRA